MHRMQLESFPRAQLTVQHFVPRHLAGAVGEHAQSLADEATAETGHPVPTLRSEALNTLLRDVTAHQALRIMRLNIPDTSQRKVIETESEQFRAAGEVFNQLNALLKENAAAGIEEERYNGLFTEALARAYAARPLTPSDEAVRSELQHQLRSVRNYASLQSAKHIAMGTVSLGSSALLATGGLASWRAMSKHWRQATAYDMCWTDEIAKCPIVPVGRLSTGPLGSCVDKLEATCRKQHGGDDIANDLKSFGFFSTAGVLAVSTLVALRYSVSAYQLAAESALDAIYYNILKAEVARTDL